MKKRPEFILCAATHFDDGKVYPHMPKNIETGKVYCGLGHGVMFVLHGTNVKQRVDAGITEKQGFLTSHNRFVDRYEGMIIARERGQVNVDPKKTKLYSEDLIYDYEEDQQEGPESNTGGEQPVQPSE